MIERIEITELGLVSGGFKTSEEFDRKIIDLVLSGVGAYLGLASSGLFGCGARHKDHGSAQKKEAQQAIVKTVARQSLIVTLGKTVMAAALLMGAQKSWMG